MTLPEWNDLVARTLADGESHNCEMFAQGNVITEAWIDAEQVAPITYEWLPSKEMPGWEYRQKNKHRREYRRIDPN